MQIRRIELEGRAGTIAIERKSGSRTIRIDSVIAHPRNGDQAGKTWEIDAGAAGEAVYEIAWELQQRADGVPGTNGDIEGYRREIERFTI